MPLFDIRCLTCGKEEEVLAPDISALMCRCGSIDVERKWTNPPMFRMKGDIQGETLGVRKYAEELTRKGAEKWSK